MPLSGYQIEALLKDFRQRFGYKKIPEHRVESLEISQEAQAEAHRIQGYYHRPKPPRVWVTPQAILEVMADRRQYPVAIEYEQQRRAGLFLAPPYLPPNPLPPLELVHDYSEKIAPAPRPQSSQPEAAASHVSQEGTFPPVPKKSNTPKALQSLDFEEEVNDFLMEETKAEAGEDHSVVFGTGRISLESMAEFIQDHTDSALKFMAQQELDGKPLAVDILDIHEQWQQRGLSRRGIRDYLLQIMEWEALPHKTLYEIWSETKDRLYDLKYQGRL